MSQTLAYVMLGLVLLTAAAMDWRRGVVPNLLTYPAIVVGLVYWTIAMLLGSPVGVVDALCGLAAGLIPFALIFYAGGLGGGDVKLMGAVGAISASWSCVLSTTVYGLVVAMLMAIFVMIRRRMVKATLMRLLAAAMGAKGQVGEADGSVVTVPLAVALALGGLVAGAEQMLGWHSPWAWLSP
jgi:Flp pilus assembly protein protease CpaA